MAEASPTRIKPLHVWMAVALVALCWSGYFHAPSQRSAIHAVENTLMMPVLAFAALALQNAAMVLTARALGDRMLLVVLGVGPKLWQRTRPRGVFAVRLLPVVSVNSLVTTRARGQRIRTSLVNLAGIVPLALLFALLLVWYPQSWTHKYANFANRLAPDSLFLYVAGWHVWNGIAVSIGALFASRELSNIDEAMFKKRRVLGCALECEVLVERGAYDQAIAMARRGLEEEPEDPTLLIDLCAALSIRRDPEAFALAESLTKRELPQGLRPIVLNVRAWECYLRGDDALREEADQASQAALAASPKLAPFLDTRGHVLLWNNRVAEAEEHLRRAFALATGRSGRTSSACGLAMLCAKANRLDEALTWLARARAQDIQHPLLARAISLIEPLRRV